MSDQLPPDDANENDVTLPTCTVRYWASARSAAGIETEQVPVGTLADVLAEISRRHRDRDRFDDVIDTCSILHGELPVGAREPSEVVVGAGDTLEFLPPFAGG